MFKEKAKAPKREPSITEAALALLSSKLDLSKDIVLKDFDRYLQLAGDIKRPLELTEPRHVTVAKKDGTYMKIALIGGEVFYTKGCYLGKRGDIIIQATLNDPDTDYSNCEFSAREAEEVLEGYHHIIESYASDYGLENEDKDRKEAAKVGKELEDAKHAEAILNSRMTDNRFGSW